jgi:hypothetical protein
MAEYTPPEGLGLIETSETFTKDHEIFLFRVPATLKLEELNSLEIPKSKTKAAQLKVTKSSRLQKEKVLKFAVKNISEDLGELKHFNLIAPMNSGYKSGFKIDRMYSIVPEIDTASKDELFVAGEKALNKVYEPRVQLEGMQLKSLPIGFDTGLID